MCCMYVQMHSEVWLEGALGVMSEAMGSSPVPSLAD